MRIGLREGLGHAMLEVEGKSNDSMIELTYDCLFNVNWVGLCILVGDCIAEDLVPNFEALRKTRGQRRNTK